MNRKCLQQAFPVYLPSRSQMMNFVVIYDLDILLNFYPLDKKSKQGIQSFLIVNNFFCHFRNVRSNQYLRSQINLLI